MVIPIGEDKSNKARRSFPKRSLWDSINSHRWQQPTLTKHNREELFKYIWGILQKKNCHLYRINGVEVQLHIVIHLHSSVSLAALVKDLKLASPEYIKANNLFPQFGGWQDGYGAFTYNISA